MNMHRKNHSLFPTHLLHAILWVLVPAAYANTVTVTSTADSGPGSMRAALAQVVDGDTIDATGVSGTILLTSGELFIQKSVTVVGPGSATLAIDGRGLTRLFHIYYTAPSGSVTISGFNLTNGWAGYSSGAGSGAGIYNDHATLTVSNCALGGNTTQITGGGIYNDHASLAVVDSAFQGNTAYFDETFVPRGSGGAIYNDQGTLSVSNTVFNYNSAGDKGGAVYNKGPAVVAYSSFGTNYAWSWFSDNTVSGSGGGIYNADSLTVAHGTFDGNYSLEYAGAIENAGILTVCDSSLVRNGNGYIDDCGGIENEVGGTLVVTNSSLVGNFAAFFGGLDNSGTATVVSSVLTGNSGSYAGGVVNGGNLTLANSTLSSNSALYSPGDNILNEASLLIVDSTIGRDASSGTNASIFNTGAGATLTIGSSILKTGGSSANITNSDGTVVSLGYNLSSDSGAGFFNQASDQINTDPMLGPLQDNGGPTLTQALLPGSPAIDKGKNFSGSPCDQRGFPRIFEDFAVPNASGGDGTDIGAFEFRADSFTMVTLGNAAWDGNAGFQFSINTLPGMNYTIQLSNDLKTWSPVLAFRGPGGPVSVIDPNAIAGGRRFYRVSLSMP